MNEPLVSIVIPCYNVKEYLEDAVESVVRQTYSNIEIILVNDGSSDGTSELCDVYARKYKNICVIHKENGGLSSARNAGMQEARGEFIYFLDSDDYIKENMVMNLVQEINESKADVIYFGSYNVDEKGNILKSLKKNIKNEKKVLKGVEAYRTYYYADVYEACVPYYFYNRKFLVDHALSFEVGLIHEDELFTLEVYHYAQKILLDSNQYYYRRIRAGSIITSAVNQKSKFDSTVRITDKVTSRSYLKDFSKDEYKNISIFLYRIQNLLFSRFYEQPLQIRKAWGVQFRRSLLKHIIFAILYRQYENLANSIERYILSIYASHFKLGDE